MYIYIYKYVYLCAYMYICIYRYRYRHLYISMSAILFMCRTYMYRIHIFTGHVHVLSTHIHWKHSSQQVDILVSRGRTFVGYVCDASYLSLRYVHCHSCYFLDPCTGRKIDLHVCIWCMYRQTYESVWCFFLFWGYFWIFAIVYSSQRRPSYETTRRMFPLCSKFWASLSRPWCRLWF